MRRRPPGVAGAWPGGSCTQGQGWRPWSCGGHTSLHGPWEPKFSRDGGRSGSRGSGPTKISRRFCLWPTRSVVLCSWSYTVPLILAIHFGIKIHAGTFVIFVSLKRNNV